MRATLTLFAIAVAAAPVHGDTLPRPVAEGGGGSVSCGAVNKGALFGALKLPERGPYHLVPEPWASRDHHYGTAELVGLIQRAAATVNRAHPGGVLGVADLAAPLGGPVRGHRSHQSGRDADVLYYARDATGAPFLPDSHMPFYTGSGLAYYAYSPAWKVGIPKRYFDTARNWALVKALLTDPQVEVERLFVGARIEYWLLRHAIRAGEPAAIVNRARAVLQQPPGVGGHMDHMHLRVACAPDDVVAGRCQAPARGRARIKRWTAACPAAGAPATER
ncbi:MAG TPA: penicillin-insensitive murein endopeptidase [Kofleriaceae bacterium]|nr:penicillin-insensitive murein endopeptidase [Kofleriaceae bacterium]